MQMPYLAVYLFYFVFFRGFMSLLALSQASLV